MLIKFKAPDPRAGMTARMDSHRGTELVEAGAATQLKGDGSENAPPVEAPAEKPTPADKLAKAKK